MSIYSRVEYEMTEEDFNNLLKACQPTRVMMIGGSCGPTPQENANNAWAKLGEKMGFDNLTVKPVPGKNGKFFTAVPREAEEVKCLRLKLAQEKVRIARIEKVKATIKELEIELAGLLKEESSNA